MRIYKFIKKQKHVHLNSVPKVYNILDKSNIPFLTQSLVLLSNSFSTNAKTISEIFPKDIVKYLNEQEENVVTHREIKINLIKSRSNVGKSSLINKILDQEITKTSKEPGKTNYLQVINMPSIELSLVDCPGYGYANRSLSERKKWDMMMNLYFGSGKKIERILILIDSVVGITEMDHEIFNLAQKKGIHFNVVFTKIDKIKRVSEIETILKKAKESIMKYNFYSPFVIFTSSKLGLGITELKCFILFSKYLTEQMQMTNRIPPQ